MSSPKKNALPKWADLGLLPLINLGVALVVSGLVVAFIGYNPFEALGHLVYGAFGYNQAFGYTLYYATNFVFTGLAVSIAYQCGLFNIGAEGQAAVGGLGMALVALNFGNLPWVVLLPFTLIVGALFGAAWAFIPAYLQAKRGSHIVITTIMFNFIAAAFLTYFLAGPLKRPDGQAPESADFAQASWFPALHEVFQGLDRSPANLSIILAILACVAYWIFLKRTAGGYEIRVVGKNPEAANYAGISITKNIIIAMLISGAFAGLMGANEILGVQHRLLGSFTAGYGFVGIAVAFMGRHHPIGLCLAAVLFGALYQGGTEMAFEMPKVTRDLMILVQGLVILFAGALEHVFRPQLTALFARFSKGAA
ncbi:MAG: ABC transporter permease [Sphingomonadales bacterium]|jgi:simple sugar transport system permease protein